MNTALTPESRTTLEWVAARVTATALHLTAGATGVAAQVLEVAGHALKLAALSPTVCAAYFTAAGALVARALPVGRALTYGNSPRYLGEPLPYRPANSNTCRGPLVVWPTAGTEANDLLECVLPGCDFVGTYTTRDPRHYETPLLTGLDAV